MAVIKLCLLCSNVEIGGLEKTLLDLREKLDSSLFDVHVCLLRNRGRFHDLMTTSFPENVHAFSRMRDAVRFLRSNSFDLIHGFGLRSDFISRLPGIRRTAKLLSYVANPDLPNTGFRKIWNTWTSSRVDCYWADSQYRANAGAERTAIPIDKIQVIYDGIDLHQFCADASRHSDIRTQLRSPATSPIIGCVGNLRHIKGHAFLIRAIPAVLRKHPDALFVFVGADFTRGEIPGLAGRMNVHQSVRFCGFYHDVASIVNTFDVFVHPSLSDGLPRSILEALALEKPVIASRVGGIPEIIEDGVNGLLIPPRSVEAVAEKIVYVLEHTDRGRMLGSNGRSTVGQKFNIRDTVAGFQQMYFRIASEKRGVVQGRRNPGE